MPFTQELEEHGLSEQVEVLATGCPGFCERGPLVTVKPQGIFYQRVQIKDVPDIVEETLVNGQVVERLLYEDPRPAKRSSTSRTYPSTSSSSARSCGSTASRPNTHRGLYRPGWL